MNRTERGALAAANRLLHGPPYEENDVALVSGVLIQELAGRRRRSKWRSWIRMPWKR